jgi:REP element-mobilizing transposase RayT
MGLPRSAYVQEGQEGVYHCFSRCVRRAFLCGFDVHTNRDFSHRKAWLVDRLHYLAAIFAIEVCAYAIMENHYHTILRTRPDIVASWTDWEVARRWLILFPQHGHIGGEPPSEEQIRALVDCPEQIAELRKRLSSLSWFMGRLNEYIARAANKEDEVNGRFWESRFKCQVLLDEAAIATCMVYVDLNPIRAGLAATPEGSDFTSIQERIRTWQREKMTTEQKLSSSSFHGETIIPENAGEISDHLPECIPARSQSLNGVASSTCWLVPISSESQRRGILNMTAAEYFDLVDKSGRMIRLDKRGAIGLDLAPILLRIGANPDAWIETVSRFGCKFHHAAGLLSNLRYFADQIGRRWLKGVEMARTAFAT